MALTGPNVNISNNPQTVTGGDMGIVLNGGTAGITFVEGNITTGDSITANDIHLTATGDAITLGTGKIRGDFSSSVSVEGNTRSWFTSSVENGRTVVTAVPNGTPVSGSVSGFAAFSSSTTHTSPFIGIFANPLGTPAMTLHSGANSTGTILPLRILAGSTNAAHGVTVYPAKDVVINSEVLATNATNGFLYIPTCAGVPTGTPTTYANTAPLVIDSTNNKMYFYSGGAWNALN